MKLFKMIYQFQKSINETVINNIKRECEEHEKGIKNNL